MKRNFLFAPITFLFLFFNVESFSYDSDSGLVKDVLTQTNKFRKSKRLPVLIMNDELNAIAQKHSVDMARGKVGFGHGGFSKRNNLAKKVIHPLNRFVVPPPRLRPITELVVRHREVQVIEGTPSPG